MPTEPTSSGNLAPFPYGSAVSDLEMLLATYFKSSTIGLAIFDSDLRYVAVNETLAAMDGMTPGDHPGKTVREVLGETAVAIEPVLQWVLSNGQPAMDFAFSGRLPGRSDVGQVVCHFIPIKDGDEQVRRVGVVIVEVTKNKQLEESVHDLSDKLRREMACLQMLLEVSCLLASNWNVQQVFPAISARIRRVLRQEYAGFELHDVSRGLLVRQAEDFPLGKGLLAGVPISADTSPGGQSLQKRSPMIFSKEQLQDLGGEIAAKFLAEGLRSLCCIPLLRPKGTMGVLVLGSTRSNAFQEDDLTLLNQIAVQLSLAIENQRAAAEIDALQRRLREERKYLEGEVRSCGPLAEMVGDSLALKQVLEQVITVAPSDATVLILGETGTGKELVARAIHRLSGRQQQPFVKVNCAAIPTGLLESELFGHEKGAFTGAIGRKIGRMELANRGTLFLDEVGDIPLELQPKLLRVLQDQEFERLGSTRTIKVNLRLIAATNRDLARRVADREFRNDLFYRLHVFPIRLPPLRDRQEDIPLLVRHFVRKFAARMNRHIESIPQETMDALMQRSWPGNIRELENLMERSVILSEGRSLRVPKWEAHNEESRLAPQADHTLDNAEREHIIRVLRETKGVLSGPNGAARRLGLKRTTLQSKMQRLHIPREEYEVPRDGLPPQPQRKCNTHG